MSDPRKLLRTIEQAAVRGWPALQSHDVSGWLWRLTSGGSVRANTVATLAFDGDLVAAVAEVEARYARHNAAVVFTISDVTEPANLDDYLATRGYVRGDDHITMAKPVDCDATLPDGVAVGVEPTKGWMEAYLSGLSPDRRSIAPRLIAGLPKPNTVFLASERSGVATSSGLTVIDGDVASVQCMATLPHERRHGGARRVLAGIEAIAAQNNARWLYLQTGADNTAARSLYQGVGFEVVGHYHTRTRPAATQ